MSTKDKNKFFILKVNDSESRVNVCSVIWQGIKKNNQNNKDLIHIKHLKKQYK